VTTSLVQGDCLVEIQNISAESVDLIVTSPPYDNIRDYAKYPPVDLQALGKECFRVLKQGGVAVLVMQDGTKDFSKSMTTFTTATQWVSEVGFSLFECVIYHRDGRPGAWWNKRFRVDHEYILIFVKGKKPNRFNKEPLKIPAIHAGAKWHGTQRLTDGSTIAISEKTQADTKCRGTVWRYKTSNTEGNKMKMQHPATFPDTLAKDVISCFSEVGDIVLDPMAGSGTVLVVAQNMGRESIGIEISEDYCQIARTRLASETGAKSE